MFPSKKKQLTYLKREKPLSSYKNYLENIVTILFSNPAVKLTGYLVDTSAIAINITLPASPTVGDSVFIHDFTSNADVYNITVLRNNNKIMGVEDDMLIDYRDTALELVYTNADRGWQVVNLI